MRKKVKRFALELNVVGRIYYLNLYTDDETGVHHKLLSYGSEEEYLKNREAIINEYLDKGYIRVLE